MPNNYSFKVDLTTIRTKKQTVSGGKIRRSYGAMREARRQHFSVAFLTSDIDQSHERAGGG